MKMPLKAKKKLAVECHTARSDTSAPELARSLVHLVENHRDAAKCSSHAPQAGKKHETENMHKRQRQNESLTKKTARRLSQLKPTLLLSSSSMLCSEVASHATKAK
ncbi:hypothetical protein BKA80DRAFT_10877 [Phyllosticta citrichinensis]